MQNHISSPVSVYDGRGFAIFVTDARSGGRFELCRVNSNPQAVAAGALAKTYSVKHTRRWWRKPCYSAVEIVELADAPL
jgi:hypothetical protein